MATRIRPSQIKEDTLEDKDQDTKIYVEKNADEDKIRFDTGGAERAVLDETELLISVPIHITGSNDGSEGLRIGKGDDNYRQIVFENDGVDSANIHLSNAENLVIMNETAGRDIQFWVDPIASSDLQAMTIKEDGKVGIGNTDPIAELDVTGMIAITAEKSGPPSQPADGKGYIYTKSDGKLYWRSHDLTETELTAGGGGGTSKHYATGHCDLQVGNKPVNWINAAAISSASAEKSWFIVPFAATLDKIIVTVKANNFSTSNDGNIALNVYKNQANFGATIVSQTVGADDFTVKISDFGSSSTDCNQKIFSGLNQSLAEGDLIQVIVSKSGSGTNESLVTMIFEG